MLGFCIGDRATLSGLVVRPDLNGREGYVDGKHPHGNSWSVRAFADGAAVLADFRSLTPGSAAPHRWTGGGSV